MKSKYIFGASLPRSGTKLYTYALSANKNIMMASNPNIELFKFLKKENSEIFKKKKKLKNLKTNYMMEDYYGSYYYDWKAESNTSEISIPIKADSQAELDDNTLTMEFDSVISNTTLSKNRFKLKANGKKLKVTSASVEGDDESFVNLVVQAKRNQVIDLQSEVILSYRDPKGDQSKQVIENLFGNDLLSVNSFFVDIV